jgi:hypothetical protein
VGTSFGAHVATDATHASRSVHYSAHLSVLVVRPLICLSLSLSFAVVPETPIFALTFALPSDSESGCMSKSSQ